MKVFPDLNQLAREFIKRSVPKTAPLRQRIEMKKAFVYGYWSALESILRAPAVDLPEEQAADLLEQHRKEVEAVRDRVTHDDLPID